MSYASISGRARTDPIAPSAHAICDRCGFRYNWNALKWQHDWRGATLQNIKLLVCNSCLDTPQEQLRAIAIPADPTPIVNARVEDFIAAEAGSLTDQPYGQPSGLSAQGAIMPLQGETAYGVPLSVLSVIGNGTTTVTVTCDLPHNLSTNDQISVEGLTLTGATGMYSVNVTTATVFNYVTYTPIKAGSLKTSKTRIVTASIGLPYGYTTIPQVGL